MLINSAELLANAKKSIGIVNDKSLVEDIRSFYLKYRSEESSLYIAGSDGSISFLSKIKVDKESNLSEDYEDFETVINAQKLFKIVSNISSERVRLVNNNNFILIESIDRVTSDRFKLSKIGDDYVYVPFELYDKECNDIFKVSELLSCLESLYNIASSAETLDQRYSQIYFDGTKAYATNISILGYVEFKSNDTYIIPIKAAKCFIDLLSITSSDEVMLGYDNDRVACVVKTKDNDVFVFNLIEYELLPIDTITETKNDIEIIVDKNKLIQALTKTSVCSDDGNIEFTLLEREINKSVVKILKFYSTNSVGEEVESKVLIQSSKSSDSNQPQEFVIFNENIISNEGEYFRVNINIENFIRCVKLASSNSEDERIKLSYDRENQLFTISDVEGIFKSIISVL